VSRLFVPTRRYRDLKHEFEYDTQIAGLERHPRMSEVLRGLEEGISAAAEEFDRVPDPPISNLRIAVSRAVAGLPSIRIYFTIDNENAVTLWFAEIDPNGESTLL
jgi:hypothetical protein